MTDEAMSPLRRRMIEDMSIRKLAPKTQHDYVQRVKDFAAFLGRSPDAAKSEDVRGFWLHLASIGAGTPKINATVSALRFFFNVTLDRPEFAKHLSFMHEPRKVPVVLSPEEVARFLEAAPSIKYKAAPSVAYGAGLGLLSGRRSTRVTFDEDGEQYVRRNPPPDRGPSLAARVGATLVDPIDDRLNLRCGKERHPRRDGVGGHLSERAGVVVEQRPDPLQRLREVGVRAVADDEDRIGWIGPEAHSRDVPGGKLLVAQRAPEIRVGRGRDAARLVVLIENTVDVDAKRQSTAIVRVDHADCHEGNSRTCMRLQPRQPSPATA
jgi:hypothetical protein